MKLIVIHMYYIIYIRQYQSSNNKVPIRIKLIRSQKDENV